METLLNEIFEDLIEELSDEMHRGSDEARLLSKIKSSYRAIRHRRNYQNHHTQEFIDNDMESMYEIVKYLVLYDWNHIGGEGETGHSENGISRTWHSREEILAQVTPFVQIL